MGGILFQYGTALHLALLTVAPLFLSPWLGDIACAMAYGWFSLFAALWVVMNPSQRFGEWPRDARARIGREIGHDPFFFFCIVAIALAVVRATNCGVGLDYEVSSGLWRLTSPTVEFLPGSVSGAGILPLAGTIALTVVTMGVRHALGGRSRLAYLFLSGFLAAIAVACWCTLPSRGFELYGIARVSENPVFFGSALGVFLLFATIAWIESGSQRLTILELLAAGSVAGIVFGILRFAPVASAWLFIPLSFALFLFGLFNRGFHRPSIAWLRLTVGSCLILAPIALLLLNPAVRNSFWPIFPKDFLPVREAASSAALAAWRESSQTGVGLGSFPLALQYFASPEDWRILSPFQAGVPNGWVQFLLERGFLGCAVMAVGLLLLLKDIVLRFFRAPRGWRLSAEHLTGVVVLLAAVAVTLVESTFVQVELMVPVCAAVALTAAALPDAEEECDG